METGTQPLERSFGIINKLGLHARAAAQLIRVANRFAAEIVIARDGVEVNAKSLLGVLTLAAPVNTTVTIRAEGPDAAEALDALGELIQAKFGEE